MSNVIYKNDSYSICCMVKYSKVSSGCWQVFKTIAVYCFSDYIFNEGPIRFYLGTGR